MSQILAVNPLIATPTTFGDYVIKVTWPATLTACSLSLARTTSCGEASWLRQVEACRGKQIMYPCGMTDRGAEAEASTERPNWRNEKLGTRIRVALWLLDEVGEGNPFTKERLHHAFPSAQVDRRLRDLRNHGWVIETSRTLAGLAPSEMLFVKAGDPVWEPHGLVYVAKSGLVPHRRIRDAVLERDGHSCTNCGLSLVEGTIDSEIQHILKLAYVRPRSEGGTDSLNNLITLCANCHAAYDRRSHDPLDPEAVWNLVQGLSPSDQTKLLAWIAMDHRPPTDAERTWALLRALRTDQRADIARRLGNMVIAQAEHEAP
ncbi:HNH endonuclease [Herbidospora daliensis]|uniref:HNH endonuclease n=1 Tax=Herbidospora daliensis TaxID=295585 RepID=UPI000A046867|nr:HNH endonuclease [Herbidospora daliensis]